jgi:hypothetical protein
MKKLVQTSAGPVLIDFYGDTIAQVVLLDEDGWEVKEGEGGDAEVGKALFYDLGIEEPEATEIEALVLHEYRARGGRPRGRWEGSPLVSIVLVPLAVVVVGIFLVGVATSAWLLWSAIT